MDKNILFTPLKLKNITLPGRIIRSATELFCATDDAHTDNYEISVFERLGKEPLGMIISSHTCISPEGHSNLWQNAIWSDEYIPDAKLLADATQQNGVPFIIQIGHGGMKGEGSNGGLPVFTSDNMTHEQIKGVVKAFGEAALRAKKAGASGVMLHGAHLYLLSQFFYPDYNHRTDNYGGSALNRFRITSEALAEVKKVCGDEYPVFLKINGDDKYSGEDYHRDLIEALNSTDELFDAVEISGWDSCPSGVPNAPYFIDNIKRLKNEVSIPLIEVGGIRSTADMLSALEAGACAVSLSRPFMRELDFATRVKNEQNAVSKCIGCGACGRPFNKTTLVKCPFESK